MRGQMDETINGVDGARFDRRVALAGLGAGTAAALLASWRPELRPVAAQEATPAADGAGYLVMRRYTLAPGAEIAEVVRRTEEGFLPIIREAPGFQQYINVDLGEGQGATISLFADEAGIQASSEQAAAWVAENLTDLMGGPPESMGGPVLLHVTAEGDAPAAGAQAGTAQAEVVRRLLAAFSAGDLAAIDELVVPDFVDRTPLPGVPPTREGMKGAVTQFRAAFPDATWTAEQLVVDGDRVAAHLRFRGTHEGAFLGIAPTRKAVEIGGIAIYRVEGGTVREEWVVRDLLGLLTQLGAIPPLG